MATTETLNHFRAQQSTAPTYWLTRFMLLRLLGVVYAVAFLVAINQLIPLIGSDGLLPLGPYLKQISAALGPTTAFVRLPSLFWFWHSDGALLTVCWIGFILSLLVVAGYANAISMGFLWFLYMSIVHVGQDWYGYGWEIQLTETGFLAIFLCPLLDMRPFPKRRPPFLIIVLLRWLIFRIMLGAGMIKIRGDETWRNGTVLYYFFETQPLPGPLTRWFHFLPHWVLRIGLSFNWIAEVAAPWFVFWPRLARHIAGVVIILFQFNIILSGNLSFLNWLTIIPALACLDDGLWMRILPTALVGRAAIAEEHAEDSEAMKVTVIVVTAVVALLSIQPVINLLSPQQIMNTSFDPLDLVNTYGAFGTVGRERYNVVFEGTADDTTGNKANWKPYIYKGLPVLLDKMPPQVAPYQLRLDWQMWFASMSTPDQYPWTFNLEYKLLHNDATALSLFAGNPFPDHPPRYVRAVLYRYQFAPPDNPQHLWWTRRQLAIWISPMSANDPRLVEFLKAYGWLK